MSSSVNAAYRAHTDGVATNLTYANVRQTGAAKTVPFILDCALTAAPLEGHARTGLIHASANQVGVCVFMMFQRIRLHCLKESHASEITEVMHCCAVFLGC